MSDGKTMVGAEIDEERHKRWKEALEESNEFQSFAQAIRVGVEQVLFADDEDAHGTAIDEEKLWSRLDTIEDELTKTQSKVIESREETPSVEEIAEEVIYRRGEIAKEKQQESGRY